MFISILSHDPPKTFHVISHPKIPKIPWCTPMRLVPSTRGSPVTHVLHRCFTEVQKIYLTFMADLLGDVAGSLGPPCETATAASVLSSFQEGHFLSSVSAKDPAEKKG